MPPDRGNGAPRSAVFWSAMFVLLAAAATAQDLFLTGGHLVDPRSRQVTSENLLILDGIIAGRPASPPADFAGEVLDVTGKWVIPGLHDLHVHSSASRGPKWNDRMGCQVAARRMLYAGVTGSLDLLAMEPFIFTLRDRQRARPHPDEADIFAAGPALTGPRLGGMLGGRPARPIDSPEEARQQIAVLAKRGPDVVKLIYEHATEGSVRPTRRTFSRETLEAAIEAAAELGIPTVVHVRIWPDARDAAHAGATAITHLPSEAVVPPDVVEIMSANRTAIIPTLAVADSLLWNEPQVLDSPLFVALTDPEMLADYRRWVHEEQEPRFVAALNRVQPVRFESLRLLAAAGVSILSGSDAGNSRIIHGHALHHELHLLVQAGLSPWLALAGSTHLAGELLGRSWGLQRGDEGSVVVLDASPIEEMRSTEKIAAVIHHGVLVDREALAERMFGSIWTRDMVAAVGNSAWFVAVNLPWWLVLSLLLLGAVMFGPALTRSLTRRRRGSAVVA